jgi:hypothetical protein
MKQETKAKKSAYDQRYMKENIIRKLIAFNRQNDRDRELLDHLNSQPNATEYIKSLIEKDMSK